MSITEKYGDRHSMKFICMDTEKHTAYLSYLLTYQTDQKIIDGVLYNGIFSDAYIDKSLSFVHPNLNLTIEELYLECKDPLEVFIFDYGNDEEE